jgi:uncharacterized membrane protein
LDFVHKRLLNLKLYKKLSERYLIKMQKKVDSFEKKYSSYGFWAMALFVGIPLPGTGVYTACLISWILGLDRKRNILQFH